MSEPRLVRGMLLPGENADQLVVRADLAEVLAFGTAPRSVALHDAALDEDGEFDAHLDRFLYNKFGQRIAVVTDVSVNVNMLDITTHGSAGSKFLRGLARADIRAQAFKVRQ